jgi:Diadenosine tetraphosphate (Ap4A) hydrolase and other HIT family hydrolases
VARGGANRVEVGVPDELERLWTPHRMAYIAGDTAPPDGYDSPTGCPFCRAPSLSDEDGLIVARGERVYAVLNRFPYNPGHLLINPYRHVADFPDLDEAETLELAQMTQTAMTVIRKVSNPAGFNLGMNQGSVAGAGIAAHLHQHIVPRWSGDTNFMPVIGRTKTLPQLLGETRRLLAEAWPARPPARTRAGGRRRTTPSDGADQTAATTPVRRRSARASTLEAPAAKASPRSRSTTTRRRTS